MVWKNSLARSIVLALVLATAHTVHCTPGAERIDGFAGVQFGTTWRSVDGLAPAKWRDGSCVSLREFYLANPDPQHALAGVQLDWPGLQYRFSDDRLYAVATEFSNDQRSNERSFAALKAYLSARYGQPDILQSWREAPPDTYIHKLRMHSAGWLSPDGSRSIWLISDDKRGSLTAVDSKLARAMAGACQPSGGRFIPAQAS